MHIGGGATAELTGAADRIDRGILPVPVACDDNHPGLGSDEASELIPFGAKGLVREVVFLCTPIGSDDRRRSEHHLERGIRGFHRFPKPRLLRGAPDRLVGAVRIGVGTACHSPLHQPDLQISAVPEGAVGRLTGGCLLVKDPDPLVECQRAERLPRPAVVAENVVVVVLKVGGDLAVKGPLERQCKDPIPFEPGELR